MKNYDEIHTNTDKWESGELGATQEFTAKDLQRFVKPQKYKVNLIYARHYLNDGIGCNGKIAWKCKEDMQFFLDKIKDKVCVVGRKTAEKLPSIPCKELLVLTKRSTHDTMTFEEMDQYLNQSDIDEIFVIGGKEIYELFLNKRMVDKIFESVLIIEDKIEFDTFFNADKTGFKLTFYDKTNGKIPCIFKTYEKEMK